MTKAKFSQGDNYWKAVEAAVKIYGNRTDVYDDKKSKKEKEKKKKKGEEEDGQAEYELSRYKTRVRRILDSFVEGELSADEFPFMGTDAAAGKEMEKEAVSLKKEKERSGWADKAKKAGKGEHKIDNSQPETRFGSRIVVFMLGGLTYR